MIGQLISGIITYLIKIVCFPYTLYRACEDARMFEAATPEEIEDHSFYLKTSFKIYMALYFATFMGILTSMTLLNHAYHPHFIQSVLDSATAKHDHILKEILVPKLNPDGSLDKTNIIVISLGYSFVFSILFAFLVGKTIPKIAWLITKIFSARMYVEYLLISLMVGFPFLYFEKFTFIKLFPVIGLSALVCSYLRPIEMVRHFLNGGCTHGKETWASRMGTAVNVKITNLKENKTQQQNVQTGPFRLQLGVATGEFMKKQHVSAMYPGQQVVVDFDDCCTNFIGFGGIGSGKTTRFINWLLVQLFRQDAGGLICDIKSDFKREVHYFASEVWQTSRREIVTIGVDNHRSINLLKGLSPEMCGTFLKSAFIMESGGVGKNAYWIDNAVNMCVGALGVLDKLDGAYSLNALYRYVFNPIERKAFTDAANKAANKLREDHKTEEYELLVAYQNRYKTHFADLDPKTKCLIESTVSTVLIGFATRPEVTRAFCEDRPDCVEMKDVLDGTIYLVDLPLPLYGTTAKVIYMWIKLLWMNVMQQRRGHPEWNQKRPIFFLCDEYQEIIAASKTGMSDLNFWDKSRSSGAVGIITMQHISSLYAAIGDKDVANTIMANFRQKVCFRTEDETTLNYFNKMLGRVERKRRMISNTETQSRENSTQEQVSYQYYHQEVLDAQLMRSLNSDVALAMLNMNGGSADDFVRMQPYYVPKEYQAPEPPPVVIPPTHEQQAAWDQACDEMRDVLDSFNRDKAPFLADCTELGKVAELLDQEMNKNGWDVNKPPLIKTPAYRTFAKKVDAFNTEKARVEEVKKQFNQRSDQISEEIKKRKEAILARGAGVISEEVGDPMGMTY